MLNNTTDFEQITMHRTERTVELEAENGCISGAEAIQSQYEDVMSSNPETNAFINLAYTDNSYS